MKTTIIALLIAFFASAGTVSAIAYYKTQDVENFTKLSNYLVDNDSVTLYKFVDGKNTCYGSYTKPVNGLGGGNAISCLK